MKYTTWWYKLLNWFLCKFISPVNCNAIKALFNGGVYWDLKEEDHDKLRSLLAKNYYVILVRRKTHLTTYLIGLASWLKTGKWGYWSHALMNVDDGNIRNDSDFKLMEATGTGVHFSTFMQVFDCDSVCLLRPKGYTDAEWVETLDCLLKQEGKSYDNIFDLADDNYLSCVELVRRALQADDNYKTNFASFEAMINKTNNLVPDMFYACPDFDIVWEVRR